MSDLKQYKSFNESQIGETLIRPVLVSAINESTARNGKPYVRLTLKDGESETVAAMFDTTAAALEEMGVIKDSVCDVELPVGEYQGAKNFKIGRISVCSDKGITAADFVRLPPVPLDKMYNEICEMLRSCADDCGGRYTPLSELVADMIGHYKEKYMTSSAAVNMHHNIRGGLLYHSYRMTRAADALCRVYSILDRELMICGTVLHDIGKLWEYNTTVAGDADFTSAGIMFGHIYLGASLIKKFTEGKNYNIEKVQMLTHMILSHHGTREWGAVVCPSTPEAFALHYIDNIDAKIYMCEDHFGQMEKGTITDKKPFGLDNRLYKSKLFDE